MSHAGLFLRGLVFVALLFVLHRCTAATLALVLSDAAAGSICRADSIAYDAQRRLLIAGACDAAVALARSTPAPPFVQVKIPGDGFACLTGTATYDAATVLHVTASQCGPTDDLFRGSFDR